MALHKLPGLISFFDSKMLTSVGHHNPGDLTHLKRPFVSTQAVPNQIHPMSPPPPPPPLPNLPPPLPPPPPPPRPVVIHPQSPTSDSVSGFAAGDVADRQLLGPAQSMSGSLGGKVMGDPSGGKSNHVVWVVSDTHLNKQQQGPVLLERKKKSSLGGPLFSPFKRMLTRGDKRRSATEISVSTAPIPIRTPSPVPTSSRPSSQSLDNQQLQHLVRTNEDLIQQLIARKNEVVNLKTNVVELESVIKQLKAEVEEAKAHDAKSAAEIRMLQDIVENQKADAEARSNIRNEQEEQLARLAEHVAALTAENVVWKAENETLKTELDASGKQCADITDQNESQEQLIQDLQEMIEEEHEQIDFLSTERDSFKRYFATAKVDAAQRSEELREKIVDLLDKQREITISIRKGLPLGRIALKKALQKTEQFLEVKAEKQMLQQKVDFLSNKSFVQDIYIVDLRQVICELAKVIYDHRLTPGYALRRALDRLNLPFDAIVQTLATPYRWESAEDTTADDGSSGGERDTVEERDSGGDSGSEYRDENGSRWRNNRKTRHRTRPLQHEEQSSEGASGSEIFDDFDEGGLATARYSRPLSNRRT